MSSTNRGYDRHKSDYYITPIKQIEAFLKEFIKYEPDAFSGVILDPAAGGDSKNPMSYPVAIKNVFGDNIGKIRTIDIRGDSQAETKEDYLELDLEYKPRVIITNPPFNIAEDIINKALKDVEDGGYVIMLLRLNFFEGVKRKNTFWSKVGLPKYSFVHHKRMSFTNDGRADSVAYQHVCFEKGYTPEFTKLKVI